MSKTNKPAAALLNMKQLAAAIGRSPWWICQAKKAGLPVFCGRSTLEDAVAWMKANPHFRAVDLLATPACIRP